MDHFLSDAKRLVQRLQNHDNAVDILISETTNLQNKLIAMRQYRDEVNQINQAANHRARSTLILGSQLENQRIQNLEQENRELSISLAEHQSALELIMNKYREQVLVMMKANGIETAIQSSCQPTNTEIAMSEKIAEMAYVMRQSASIDESVAAKEIEALRSLQVENDNLRELLDISGKHCPRSKSHEDIVPVENGVVDNNDTKIYEEDIHNKDSGIYDEDSSENLVSMHTEVKKTDYKPLRIKSKSKHINNLHNLFENPVVNPNSDKDNTTDFNDLGFEQGNDDGSYRLYTIERFIPNEEIDGGTLPSTQPEKSLSNSDFLDIFRKNKSPTSDKKNDTTSRYNNIDAEIPDVGSEESKLHHQDVNKDPKDIFSINVPNTLNENTGDANEEDALQMLDDAIDFDFEEFETGTSDETEFETGTSDNTLESQLELTSSTTKSDSLELNEPSNEPEKENENLYLEHNSKEADVGYSKQTDNGDFSDTSSESSEATVVDAGELMDVETTITADEEEAIVDFDSFLDDQFNLDDDDDNDNGDIDNGSDDGNLD